MKQRRQNPDELPAITRALYGSAVVLALLGGSDLLIEVARAAQRSFSGLLLASSPDFAMAAVSATLVGLGWLISRFERHGPVRA